MSQHYIENQDIYILSLCKSTFSISQSRQKSVEIISDSENSDNQNNEKCEKHVSLQ